MKTDHEIAWWEYEWEEDEDRGWWSGKGTYGEADAREMAQQDRSATGRYRPVYAVPGEPRDVKEERNA